MYNIGRFIRVEFRKTFYVYVFYYNDDNFLSYKVAEFSKTHV